MTTLALRALGLGDLCVAVPALRALRRARPDDRLVLAAPTTLAPLVRRIGGIDELVDCATPEELPRTWATRLPPDLAVNLHGDGTASEDALLATGPARYLGERCRPPAGPCHERERWCRLLVGAGLCGPAEAPADDLRCGSARPVAHPPVVIHPGAAFGAKRWPVERFGAVARALDGDAHPAVVTGNAQESDATTAVVRAAGLDPGRDRAGRTDLGALVELVRTAAVVISGDTGIAHVAAAFGVPSVTIFGPVPASRWGPPAGPHRALGDDAARCGDPFAAEPDPALLGVGVADVLDAARAVAPALARRSGPGRR